MKLTIEWLYETPKKQRVLLTSEAVGVNEAFLLIEDMQKTGRVKQMTITDDYDSTWTLKELKKYLQELEQEPHDVRLYFDGGFWQKEQQAGLGVVIYFAQNDAQYRLRINRQADYLLSNNEAEYAALLFALEQLEELGVHHQTIDIFGDSQVVIHELNGEWGVHDGVLAKWADKIEHLLERLGLSANYLHIERKGNSEADQLATQALEGTMIYAKQQIKR